MEKFKNQKSFVFRGTYKISKAADTFVMSVHLSHLPARTIRPPRNGRIFMKFDIWKYLETAVRNIQVSLKSENINV